MLVRKLLKMEIFILEKTTNPKCLHQKLLSISNFTIFQITKKKAEHFKKTLLCFPPETEPNLFFLSVVYTLSYLQRNEKPKDFLTAIKTIGEEKFLKLKEIEKNIMLDLVFLKIAQY